MNDSIYDDMAIEQIAKKRFGIDFEISRVIVRRVPVSPTAKATVFLTEKNQLFCCIAAQAKLNLGDVKKMVKRMGLSAEAFLPPAGRPNYFDDIGREHFRTVFPGMGPASDKDLIYYRTLAPYNPALVLISEIPHGEIRQYDTDAHGNWRPSVKFAYRKIKTS